MTRNAGSRTLDTERDLKHWDSHRDLTLLWKWKMALFLHSDAVKT